VDQHVRVETAHVGEGLLADDASVRFLAGVHLQVRLQRGFGDEALAAVAAQKRLLPVREAVGLEEVLGFVGARADVAHVLATLVLVLFGFCRPF
jgi:hypothetical protein